MRCAAEHPQPAVGGAAKLAAAAATAADSARQLGLILPPGAALLDPAHCEVGRPAELPPDCAAPSHGVAAMLWCCRGKPPCSAPAKAPFPACTTCLPLPRLQVHIYTSSEQEFADTCSGSQVCLELVGNQGASGPICLPRAASADCFFPGALKRYDVEAPAVGEVQQLNIWLEGPSAAEGGEGGAGVCRLPA